MTFVDRPLPDGLELPKLQDKRLANLKHEGRIPGSINKISKDLKLGIIEGAAAYGYDGSGAGGLHGYLAMCAAKFPKAYLQVLSKLVPIQVSGDGLAPPGPVAINIVSVPHDCYLSAEDIARIRGEPLQIEQQLPPEPAPEPNPRLAALEAELNNLSLDELMVRAGVTNADQG